MSAPDPFQEFYNVHSIYHTSVDEIYQFLLQEFIEGKQSYHLSNSKVTFLQPEQQEVRIIILNEKGLELRMSKIDYILLATFCSQSFSGFDSVIVEL